MDLRQVPTIESQEFDAGVIEKDEDGLLDPRSLYKKKKSVNRALKVAQRNQLIKGRSSRLAESGYR